MTESAKIYKLCSSCFAQFENADALAMCPHDGTALSSVTGELLTGVIIKDKYKLLAVAGVGGWGVVYKAEHLELHRPIAIKLLHKHLLNDQDRVARFHQEAKAVAALSHPNLVYVHDFGSLPDGQLFIAMDYLEGRALSEVLSAQQRLEASYVIDLLSQACCALTAMHEVGLIHRDLKPSNMIVVPEADRKTRLVICDFGLAKFTAAEQSLALTNTDQILGTPAYMSPEQCLGRDLDPRSDIYSIGCVMYELITGTPPFNAESYGELLKMHVNAKPIPPSNRILQRLREGYESRAPRGVPHKLEQIVLRALEKDPSQRYQTAFEMLEDLWDAKLGIENQSLLQKCLSRSRLFFATHKGLAISTLAFGGCVLCAVIVSPLVGNGQKSTPKREPEYRAYVAQADRLFNKELDRAGQLVDREKSLMASGGTAQPVQVNDSEQADRLRRLRVIANLLEKALSQVDADHLPNSEVLPILERLRTIYANLAEYRKLAGILNRELSIYLQSGSKPREYAANNMLTWCYYSLREAKPAQMYAERTLQLATDVYGKKSLQYGEALQDLGSVNLLSKNYETADKYLTDALQYEAAFPGLRLVTMAQIVVAKAGLGQLDQAQTYLQTVVDESKMYPPVMKLTVGSQLQRFADEKRASGNETEAKTLEQMVATAHNIKIIGMR